VMLRTQFAPSLGFVVATVGRVVDAELFGFHPGSLFTPQSAKFAL
jgi:hypothetical protein